MSKYPLLEITCRGSFEQVREVLVLTDYAQRPQVNAHTYVSSDTRGLILDLNIHPYPY